jgi:hypothetical protein
VRDRAHRADDDPRRDRVAAELDRRGRRARGVEHRRAQPQRLLHDRLEVRRVAARQLLLQPRADVRHAREALELPGDRRRGDFVPEDDEADELVANRDVGERRAVLIVGVREQREDVVALVTLIGARAGARDRAEQEAVDRRAPAPHRASGVEPAGAVPQRRREHRQREPRVVAVADFLAQQHDLARVELAQHDAADHAEGDPPRDRQQRDRPAPAAAAIQAAATSIPLAPDRPAPR